MKAQHNTFIKPRAPFGYRKSESTHEKLISDPKAAIIVPKKLSYQLTTLV